MSLLALDDALQKLEILDSQKARLVDSLFRRADN